MNATETTTTYPIEDMKAIMDAIEDPNDWRAEINAWIPANLYPIAREAVIFYTATDLEVVGGPQPITGNILVHATGYRNGPAGP